MRPASLHRCLEDSHVVSTGLTLNACRPPDRATDPFPPVYSLWTFSRVVTLTRVASPVSFRNKYIRARRGGGGARTHTYTQARTGTNTLTHTHARTHVQAFMHTQ